MKSTRNRAENAALRHDLERILAANAELASENAELRAKLAAAQTSDDHKLARAGAVAYAELLREVKCAGTDKQAYDHIMRRLQDLHGSYQTQITKATDAALALAKDGK